MAPSHQLVSLLFGGVVLALAGCDADNIPAQGDDEIVFQDGSDEELLLAEDRSYQNLFADADGPVRGKGIDGLRTLKVNVDEVGMAHTKVQQLHNNVPVWGGEAIVHLARNGKFSHVTDDLIPDIKVNTTPDYTADEAIDLAVDEFYNGWDELDQDPVADLWILRQDGVDHLVYRVQLHRIDGTAHDEMPVMFIDAHTGELVWQYNNLQSATCSGTTNAYGTVSVDCYSSGGTYYLEDTTDLLGTYSYNGTTSTLSYVTSTSTTFGTSTYTKNAVEAHYTIQKVYDYYKSTFGRNGINGSGGPGAISSHGYSFISSATSYSSGYVNAYWDSTNLYMVYGDGDGVYSNSLTTLDVGGHELTHGVTQYEANLTYSGESGGLNESMSDIFGAMVERSVKGESSTTTWYIGEDTWTPGTSGDALRYMSDPYKDGYSLDYYSSSAATTDVHYSSGISNLAFYLLSKGGTHPRGKSTTTVTAITASGR